MKSRILMIVLCGAMLVPCSALAQSPTQSAYSGTGASQVSQVASTGTLPFTGINAGVVGVIGVFLIGSGFMLRRASRTRTD